MKKFILLASLLLGSFAFGISKELDFTAESTYCKNPDYRYAKYSNGDVFLNFDKCYHEGQKIGLTVVRIPDQDIEFYSSILKNRYPYLYFKRGTRITGTQDRSEGYSIWISKSVLATFLGRFPTSEEWRSVGL